MSLRNTLTRLTRVVIDEAERNPEFEAALNDALGTLPIGKRKQPKEGSAAEPICGGEGRRGKNRRPPAALDPVQVVRDGEAVLRAALEKLSLEQLRDIVAECGMDPSRLVMKWMDPVRVMDRIVELSIARARKGDAFRKPTDVPQTSLAGDASITATLPVDTPPDVSHEDKSSENP